MVPDPYKSLNLPHTATPSEIKRSYRELARKCHPDRITHASEEEKHEAAKTFSKISSAYALLMDPQRKSQYDHIYKYGGYDDEEEEPSKIKLQRDDPEKNSDRAPSRKRKSVGVGYSCTDPFAFLWTSGDVLTTKKIAGIQIPSRFQMGHPGAGFQVSVSTGEFRYDGDKRQYTSRTTQFAHGKKISLTETTTIHRDGRKEVLTQGDDFCEMRTSNVQSMASHEEHALPWYISAWHGMKDKLSMCYSPTVNSVV
mmetsp:Transcript_4261/g.5616  ORF Transcript_4261/g.5616 Transcript_4261/m.5616 type:complete len:254 (+) Transcript_4261:226-987(+)|eukprot:CAMPEP_0198145922 /NCGR_PEP_ID=MMETSP1443-20131203/26137_1 /TAXON_ID=186043 /ORGANISM="Entomoneis sp., Strain CCMP2396" /LENGTH=253 /DNA_ID=CAMNT_0043809685 /DNA_START=225 /DNA_END=986 /DNA_ORIENTATION=+